MEKEEIIQEWKRKIATDKRWAIRALIVIYENQTADEKDIGVTKHNNGVGFNGTDAELLTSFAQQVNAGRNLSQRQTDYLFKKMPKYAGQLYRLTKG
jgi:hypothetical protein